MKFVIAFFGFLLLAPATASAQAEETLGGDRRLTIIQSMNVLSCLRSLDGYQEVVKVGDKDQIVTKAYEFKNSNLRWSIIRNIAIATEVETALQASRNSMIRELSDGGREIKPGTPVADEFTLQWEKLMSTPTALSDKFVMFAIADLKLEKNEIPGSLLAGCAPIIKK